MNEALEINVVRGNIATNRASLSGNILTGNTSLSGTVAMPKSLKFYAKWGSITGNLEDQEDLMEYLSVIDCGSSTEVV